MAVTEELLSNSRRYPRRPSCPADRRTRADRRPANGGAGRDRRRDRWETRGGRRDFTYGRAMTWVALDSAVRLARDLGRPADLVRWSAARDAIYEQIMEKGWNSERKAFVQYHGTDVMDAS